jgi:acyl carrier protein
MTDHLDAERAEIVGFLRRRVAEAVGLPPEQVSETGHLISEYGLASIDAVMLSGEIEDRYRVELEPTTLFDRPTIGQVADVLLRDRGAGRAVGGG